jgi:hypothetical protein
MEPHRKPLRFVEPAWFAVRYRASGPYRAFMYVRHPDEPRKNPR